MTEVTEAEPAAVEGAGLLANSSALLASRLVVAALGWGGMALIAQRLSIEEFGQLSFVLGLLGLTTIVTNLGVGRVVLAALVRDHDDVETFAGTYIVLRAVLGLAGYGAAVAFVALGGYPPVVVQATSLGGLMVLIATPSHALDAVFQAPNAHADRRRGGRDRTGRSARAHRGAGRLAAHAAVAGRALRGQRRPRLHLEGSTPLGAGPPTPVRAMGDVAGHARGRRSPDHRLRPPDPVLQDRHRDAVAPRHVRVVLIPAHSYRGRPPPPSSRRSPC